MYVKDCFCSHIPHIYPPGISEKHNKSNIKFRAIASNKAASSANHVRHRLSPYLAAGGKWKGISSWVKGTDIYTTNCGEYSACLAAT